MRPNPRFVQSYVQQGRVGVLVEFGVETWPVTVSPQFLELSRNVAIHVAVVHPESVDALLEQAYVNDPAVPVKNALADTSARMGTEISVTRFVRWSNELQTGREPPVSAKDPTGAWRRVRGALLALGVGRSLDGVYPHPWFIQSYADGSVGVLVEFGLETWRVTERPEFLKLASTLAKYVAAINPESMDGLLRHAIGKDSASTVEKLLALHSTVLRERITITRFVRWGCLPNQTEPPVPPKTPAVALRLKRA